jgi:hypothetical protein
MRSIMTPIETSNFNLKTIAMARITTTLLISHLYLSAFGSSLYPEYLLEADTERSCCPI